MKRRTGWIVGAALTFALPVGGSLSAAPPPSSGTIAIVPQGADGDDNAPAHSFVDAASEALTAKGFTILDDPAHAAYLAELTLSQTAVGTGLGNPHGAGVSVNAGVVVPFSTGQSSLVTLERTRLEIRIRKRGDGSSVWDGAAVTVRATGTRGGTNKAVASDLSHALLESYPVEPKDVVGVP